MTKRPSFQFYPADWRSNTKLRRCSEAARGAWIDILCVLHDGDEYGLCRWPLSELCAVAAISPKSAKELVAKGVLKGSDDGEISFVHVPRHAGKELEPVVLLKTQGPCWFSSRMLTDEWARSRRGIGSRFTGDNQPSRTPIRRIGDGPTTPSPSPTPSSVDNPSKPSPSSGNDFSKKPNGNGHGLGSGGHDAVTIKDPSERIARFQAKLAPVVQGGWETIFAAVDDTNPNHGAALALCKTAAHDRLGKGWPKNWPTDQRH